ncbi:MAG: Appr-1-p processing protein [Alphaproteobacteria bacterium]|nr:Appr-1-p processing protein [Alphaproteobacteria bacterium]
MNKRIISIPKMTAEYACLIGLARRYLSAVMDPAVTLLELQKLMYFMQEAGEPLQLKYQKAPYGPYAQNLGHVLKMIEGHFVLGYKDGDDDPKKPLELIKEAIDQAEDFLKSHEGTRNHFEQVTDLIQGFETPYGMELLASVHWALKHEGAGHNSVVDVIHNWNDRKKMFPAEHIHAAVDVLQEKGWVSA